MSGVFFIFLSIIITITNGLPSKRGCQHGSTDIFFLMDSSGSIQTKNFADQLKFVYDVVNNLDMKRNDIQVGMASFSDSFYLNADLTEDKNTFLSSISGVFPLSGSTRIGRALTYLKNEGFGSPLARKDAQKVIILITDGESVDNPFPMAEELKSQGVQIFAIEAKHVNNRGELRLIASKPTYRFLFTLDAQNVVAALVKTISNIGCHAPDIRDNCQRMHQQDIRFLIDLAGFGRLKSNEIMKFTFKAINLLRQKNLNGFFSIEFSAGRSQGIVNISSMANITAIMQGFDHAQFPGPQGIISSFLLHPKLFDFQKHRKKIMVIFVDASSEPLKELKSVVDEFRSMDKYASISIITIGPMVRQEEAKKIASDESLYFHIPNIDEIENSYEDFSDLLCNPQDYHEYIFFEDIKL